MKRFLEKLLNKQLAKPQTESSQSDKNDVKMAACAILLEVAHADDNLSEEEKTQIDSILKEEYELSDDEINSLVKDTEQLRSKAVDLWSFTSQINEVFSRADKMKIMENIWQVVFADNHLDKYEDYLAHKLAKLLRLQHSDMIKAKLNVKHSS